MNKAIFIDRDGVVNIDYGYVHSIDRFDFVPKAVEALKKLADSDFMIIIVTNQSGIGRGLYSLKDFKKVMDYMNNELARKGVVVDDIYFCPHNPEDDCSCRKPKPKMILDAAKKHNIELAESWMIGDKDADVFCGKNAGCKTVFVKTEKNRDKAAGDADFIVNDLHEAVEKILIKA